LDNTIYLFDLVLIDEYNYEIPIKFILISFLIISSALISGSEVAFFSLSSTDLKKSLSSSSDRLRLVGKLRNQPKRLLATLLVSNNFINIAIVLLFSSFGNSFYYPSFPFWINFLFEIGFITLFILLFGEILPKVYASRNPISFSKKMALPIKFLDKYIFFFLTIPMSKITELLQKKLVFKSTDLSVDKLSDALDLTDKTETTRVEKKILKGIVSFGSIETKQVMKARTDVFYVSKDLRFEELIKKVRKRGFSRIPVYENKIDNVIGIIYLKDLFPYLDNKNFHWNKLIREPIFVPENKKLDDLLAEFQKLKIHLAVVVDEYGGNSGIITLEDIVEEIVGDLQNEFIQDDQLFQKLDSKNYIFDGKTNLKDLYNNIKINDISSFENKKGESETIAGFILEQTGYFPKKGFTLQIGNLNLIVEEIKKKRITKIKITIT
tara:strand:- start:3642 stop:4952 length:1311 start_codon:yes stop_codon:yes gene_type:complete